MNEANYKEYNQIIDEQAELLLLATDSLTKMLANLFNFLNELSQIFAKNNSQEQKDILEYEYQIKKLFDYVDHVHIEIPSLTDIIKESEKQQHDYAKTIENQKIEIEILRSDFTNQKKEIEIHRNEVEIQNKEIDAQKKELETQKQEIVESQRKYDDIKQELTMQSSFSAAMGYVLGTMLWKTSKTEEVIETYIDIGVLNEFMNMTNVTLKAFRETYAAELPSNESFEYKFLLSLFGIYVNIVAQKIGRDFVLEREVGVLSIKSTLSYLGKIPMPSGNLLKRLILMMIYNVSITKRGAILIEEADQSIENILKCCDPNHTVEIQSLALTLMNTLLSELPAQEFCENLMKQVSQIQGHLELIMASNDVNLKGLCSKLIDKLNELNEDY